MKKLFSWNVRRIDSISNSACNYVSCVLKLSVYCHYYHTHITDSMGVSLSAMGVSSSVISAFGVAHQAVESISVKGETVLVLGCGPVGLFAAGIAKCMGASKVYVFFVVGSEYVVVSLLHVDC